MGTGKTAYLTWILKQHFEEGRKIYTNYPVFFPHEKLTHPFQLVELDDCVLGIDEAYLWFSSVASQRKLQIALSNIYRKFRKKDVDAYATSQRFKNLHIRYRKLCDLIFKMRARPPIGQPKYFEAVPCVLQETGNSELILPIGAPVRFGLDEVKELFDTKADIYTIPGQDQEALDLLASVPASEFFAGNPKKSAIDELIGED